MKLSKILLASFIPLFLTACSSKSSLETELTPPVNAAICCENFSDFPWVSLTKTEDLDFKIDDSSPVGRFVSGNSHFAAFALSSESKRVHIRLASKMLNGTVFAPKLIALDKDFNIVEVRELASFDIQAADAFSRNQYLLNLMLDREKTPYFVIYTKATELGKIIKVDHPAKIRAKQYGDPMPMVTDPEYTFSPFGSLSMKVATITLQGYKDVVKEEVKEVIQTEKENPKTAQYYFNEIDKAIDKSDLAKAVSLYDEAKERGIADINAYFVEAMKMY